MHGFGNQGLTQLATALIQKSGERVLQKAATGHHRQSGRFVDHQQIPVVMHNRPDVGDGRLDPWRTVPEQFCLIRQRLILEQKLSVESEFTSSDSAKPDVFAGVAVTLSHQLADQRALIVRVRDVPVRPSLIECGWTPTFRQRLCLLACHSTRRCCKA